MLKQLNLYIIRMCDVAFSGLGLMLLAPLFLILYIVGWWFIRSPVFKQVRIGRYQKKFVLLKFRTMKKDTASVPTYLLSTNSVTPYGKFLRKTKLDELPQLWNVFKGEMSLVGPRPGLPNQVELTDARENHHVFEVRPGVTGLAQISLVDMSTPEALAKTDKKMIDNLTLIAYFKYLFLTVFGKGYGDGLSQKSQALLETSNRDKD